MALAIFLSIFLVFTSFVITSIFTFRLRNFFREILRSFRCDNEIAINIALLISFILCLKVFVVFSPFLLISSTYFFTGTQKEKKIPVIFPGH